MDWTLADIRSKVRTLTGKLSSGQKTDSALNDHINHFYRNTLPVKLRSPHFDGWWEYATVVDGDVVDIDADYLSIGSPFTIDGIEYPLYQNPSFFYSAWPETQTYDSGTPYAALLFNRQIILRPPPDSDYDLKARAIIKPDALVNGTDMPLNPSWGLLIAHGTAIDIFLDDNDIQAATELSGAFQSLFDDAVIPVVLQLSSQRSVPGF